MTERDRLSIAVIINNHNYDSYLEDCIRSVILQQRCADEFIIVDDGSTDSSSLIMENYAREASLIYKKNGGQASAINVGFAASKADLLVFLDADDMLMPHCLSLIEQGWRSGLSKLHFGLDTIDSSGKARHERRPPGVLPSGDLLGELLEKGSYLTTPTSGNAFSRAFLNQVMPIPEAEWLLYADTYLLFLAPIYGRIGAIQRSLGLYRVHDGNSTGLVREGHIKISKIRGEIERDLRQQALIESFCRIKDLRMRKDAVLRSWSSIKLRIVSLKIERRFHPVSSDNLSCLFNSGVEAIYKEKGLNKKGFLMLFWLVVMIFAPSSLARRLAVFSYNRPDSGGHG